MDAAPVTPATFLQDLYRLVTAQAREAIVAKVHATPQLAAVVVSPYNPPEVHVTTLLDGRMLVHTMRALIVEDPAIFGFVFVGLGTTLHEQDSGPPAIGEALMVFWVTRDDAGGASYRIVSSPLLGTYLRPPDPLPEAQRALYIRALDPTAPLPTMLAAPPS